MTNPLRSAIRDVPDFPKPGILFKDITPVLSDPELFRLAISGFKTACAGFAFDKIAAVDARGFFFGAVLSHELGVGLVPIRKKGKLPYQTVSHRYALEYGEAELEVHVDAVRPGERVILIDDLLATGGTSAATITLLKKLGAEVPAAIFLVELLFLHGRDTLSPTPVEALIAFD